MIINSYLTVRVYYACGILKMYTYAILNESLHARRRRELT